MFLLNLTLSLSLSLTSISDSLYGCPPPPSHKPLIAVTLWLAGGVFCWVELFSANNTKSHRTCMSLRRLVAPNTIWHKRRVCPLKEFKVWGNVQSSVRMCLLNMTLYSLAWLSLELLVVTSHHLSLMREKKWPKTWGGTCLDVHSWEDWKLSWMFSTLWMIFLAAEWWTWACLEMAS